jgi:hypothetical protein
MLMVVLPFVKLKNVSGESKTLGELNGVKNLSVSFIVIQPLKTVNVQVLWIVMKSNKELKKFGLT